jgi:hypothetical protein
LDLGNYERYLNITLTRENNITTGKIYQHVIEREARFNPYSFIVSLSKGLLRASRDVGITWERQFRSFLT